MFRIGDFSKLSRVSIRMLRHYDETGLLTPARVDAGSGYRYYSADQLPRLNRIVALRGLGFSLEQIAALLRDDLSPAELRGVLKLRRGELALKLRMDRARLAEVEARLRALERGEQLAPYDVIVREVPPRLMASLRRTVPSLGAPIADMFDEVEAYVARHGARSAASPLTVFHDAEYRETDLDVQVAVPVTRAIPGSERVAVGEVAGAATMACAAYTGGYERTGEVIRVLLLWGGANGWRPAGKPREVYLRFAADNVEALRLPAAFLTDELPRFVTEIQLPVKRYERR
ncbi:MAG: MerR family transcriptional regulator [Gemmatimonadaceae bacterium]